LNVADLDLRQLVPHSGPMLLIDELISANDQCLEAACTVRDDGLFDVGGGRIPAMICVEYMAQAVAAFAGVRATLRGESIRPGLLLGARNFTSTATYLSAGDRLRITVALVIESANGLAVFDCEITAPDLHAGARLTVITTNSLDDLGATT
jgi:predicted hotdog family 3-hydroxylacyl-ACP dehydratase